jgi:hypothetical protein
MPNPDPVISSRTGQAVSEYSRYRHPCAAADEEALKRSAANQTGLVFG